MAGTPCQWGRWHRSCVLTALASLMTIYVLLQVVMVKQASIRTPEIKDAKVQAEFSQLTSLPTHTVKPPQATAEDDEDIPDVPIYLSENPKYKPKEASKHQQYLSIHYQGGLGNSMFAYASLWGISHQNYMRPLWPGFHLLRNYFHLDNTDIIEATSDKSWVLFLEDGASIYDDRTTELNYDLDILLFGFFQSWKYFVKQTEAINRHFRFRGEIASLANRYLEQAREESYGLRNFSTGSVTFIGVHIRRGDMLHVDNVNKGYTIATVEYLETAMIFYASRHNHILFVVCSDDIPWSRHNVPPNIGPVAYSSEHYDIEDLAILSLCNHTIMTVGTFGWWAGWLAGGTVLYYADFPARNSELEKEFNPKDFYPPKWIGISYRIKHR